MVIEISFPRGGRKPLSNTVSKPHKDKKEKDLFGNRKNDNFKTKEKKVVKESKQPIDSDFSAESANLLSYQTIQNDMVLLGCIREVQKMTIGISLPGRLSGRVMITQISSAYTQLLHSIADDKEPEGYKSLRQLFTPGQCVATKVVKIDGSDKYRVSLSMNPQDVNAQMSHTAVVTGMLMWGAITSCEDHGYVVDLGIPNCRAFLPKDMVDEDKVFVVGEPFWSVVQKCESSAIATTINLNAKSSKVNTSKIMKDTSLDYLLPGMKVDLTISQQLYNGLEGKFLNDYTGYIHEAHYRDVLDKVQAYPVETVVEARIMYVMPITKLTYLTLRSLEPGNRDTFTNGTITNAIIFSNARGGMYLKLNDNQKGFVSYRRLKTVLPLNSETNEAEYIKSKYPKGSKHKCRILDYDYLDRVYICTFEKNLLEEKVFTLNDLKPAQEVSAIVTEIQNNGLLVQVGNVTGFVQNHHLTDLVLQSYVNIKSKFHVGQTIKAKVWVVKIPSDLLLLTLKPSLLNCDTNLTSYKEANYNEQYPGVVQQITTNGLLIEFFGNVCGWVPKHQLNIGTSKHHEMFKIGQVVKCTVIKCKNEKLTLSLQPPKSSITTKHTLHAGQHVSATVLETTEAGLVVSINNHDIKALVPLLHITKFPSIASLLAKTYNEGEVISDLVCVNAHTRLPVLSMRDTFLNETNIPNFGDIKKGDLISGSVQYRNKHGLNVLAVFKESNKLIKVPSTEISETECLSKFDKNQPIVIKVLNVNKKTKEVTASAKLYSCWNCDLNFSIDMLSDYLKETDRIKDHFSALGKPLATLNLGQIVTGIVQNKTDKGEYRIELTNGAFAHVQPEHVKGEIIIGSEVKGVVLWLNFDLDYAEVSLCTNLISRINQMQDGDVEISTAKHGDKNNAHGEVLLVTNDTVLVVLRGKNWKRQIIYLPTKLHHNDFVPNLNEYKVGNIIKVEVQRAENGKIIGVPKSILKFLFNKVKSMLLSTRKLSESSKAESEEPMKKKRKMENGDLRAESLNETTEIRKECLPKEDKLKKKKKRTENIQEANEIIETTEKPTKKNKKKTVQNNENQTIESETIEEEMVMEEVETKNVQETKKPKQDKKRKADIEAIKPETQNTNDETNSTTKKLKLEDSAPILPGANNFWNLPEPTNAEDDESSGDEDKDEAELAKQQKKKKLTPAERAEAARLEEERIRKIETELADSASAPKTADQFDRVVLANPNNSMLWINYMAFHLEATEIEKARTIARKALSTIEFREEQEKLNVWIALLNLENRYGTKDSFTEVLEEAVKMNDSLSVYLQALNILAESKKTTDFNEVLTNVTRKFKQEFKMWIEAADACYKCELKEQARNLMQRALKSIDEKQHVNLLVQFAFMESRYEEPERAEALLEKVLASYPRRVDVWTSYVDMLIKGNRIHIARNVLERAVCQKLPARKMKTIFTKFVQFETKYGDEDSVRKVREMAAEYVQKALK